MGKTFSEEFADACKRLDEKSPHLRREADRVHQETVRDGQHAYSKVDIVKPDPWKRGTELTI